MHLARWTSRLKQTRPQTFFHTSSSSATITCIWNSATRRYFGHPRENDESYLRIRVCLLKSLPPVYFYITNVPGLIETIVRYTPILNSRGPDPHDINEPFESVFTPLQRDGIPGVSDWAEAGSMPCPEREMKVTGFHAKWVKALINVGPNSVEHHAWILQSPDYGRRTFVGRIGGKYMILQKK